MIWQNRSMLSTWHHSPEWELSYIGLGRVLADTWTQGGILPMNSTLLCPSNTHRTPSCPQARRLHQQGVEQNKVDFFELIQLYVYKAVTQSGWTPLQSPGALTRWVHGLVHWLAAYEFLPRLCACLLKQAAPCAPRTDLASQTQATLCHP